MTSSIRDSKIGSISRSICCLLWDRSPSRPRSRLVEWSCLWNVDSKATSLTPKGIGNRSDAQMGPSGGSLRRIFIGFFCSYLVKIASRSRWLGLALETSRPPIQGWGRLLQRRRHTWVWLLWPMLIVRRKVGQHKRSFVLGGWLLVVVCLFSWIVS